jgi:regulator of RNase E activity RraA
MLLNRTRAAALAAVTVLAGVGTLSGTRPSAQTLGPRPESLARYTAPSTYDRFPDGRPRVPDALLQTLREMQVEVEEAYGVVRQRGYMNQYEDDWRVLLPDQRLIGRAFTVQFVPARPDLAEGLQQEATESGIGRLQNQAAIDLLQKDDVPVVDLFGKVEGGTFVGDKLAHYVQKVTGTGLVVNGGLFYLRRLEQAGMPAYYRGAHPGSLSNVLLSGVNVPVRIGDAMVMPGDIVLGDRDGILFIPPHLVEEVIAAVRTQRLRDQWIKSKFDSGQFKSRDIYYQPSDPALLKELQDFLANGGATPPRQER